MSTLFSTLYTLQSAQVAMFRSPRSCCLLRLRTKRQTAVQMAKATTPLTTTMVTKLVEKDLDSSCSSGSPEKREVFLIKIYLFILCNIVLWSRARWPNNQRDKHRFCYNYILKPTRSSVYCEALT